MRFVLPRRVLLLASFLLGALLARAALTPTDLRCDWAVNPLGIDSATPHLAWKLAAPASARDQRQTAWQIRAATSLEKLTTAHASATNTADLWDSGRVDSAAQLQIPYAGRPLRTGEQVFWQVRVWDAAGETGPWSEPAKWTTGVVPPADWQAKWITDPELLRVTRQHLGFSTPPVTDENTPQWLALDLGRSHVVDEIVLHALMHTVSERLGFPRWFKIELSEHADFRDATVVADTTANPTNLWFPRIPLPVKNIAARYVRLTAPRLRMFAEEGSPVPLGRLALRQIEVRSAGKNIAVGAKVTASASLEDGPWSAQAIVDGQELPGSNPRATSTLLLRREFPVDRATLTRATLFVSGLGHYALSVNGQAVGAENLLSPGWTDYPDTVLYDTHDVTAQLRDGANVLGLTLANGMYNVPSTLGRYTKFVSAPRALKAIAQLRLDYADGRVETICSDENWHVAPGPTTFAHVYGGEDHDARLEPAGWDRPGFDASSWTHAALTEGPGGKLRGASSAAPRLRAHENLKPIAVRTLRPGVEVYDLGQNAALMPRLRVRGPAGSSVKITPTELVKPDGSISLGSLHYSKNEAYWKYTLTGSLDESELWFPRFFYHGARYLQVERFPATNGADGELPVIESLEGVVVHSDSPAIGYFACSNELFNRIRSLVRWAQRSNLSHVLTDCPHRERLGWLEQYHLNGPSLRYEFELTRLFTKTFGDMADGQRPNGLVPSTQPEYVRFEDGFRDSPEWGSALILAAWQQYIWTGDDTPLHRHYPAMQRYFDYLTSRADRRILSHGLGDWYDLGPNHPGLAQLTPIALTATAIYYEDARTLARIAQHLRKSDDSARYTAEADAIAVAFNARFVDPAKPGIYATGSQTSQAMPLALGLVPADQRPAALTALIRDIESRGNALTAGDVGYRYVLRALAEADRSDVIFAMNNQSGKPGYGYQLARGATALTEAWDASPNSSNNHFMLGQIMEWFYHDLAGLAPDPTAPGFARAIIHPQPVGDVTWAEANLDSVRGRFAVRWEKSPDGAFTLKLTVPPNARASIQLPVAASATLTESGRPIAAPALTGARPTLEVGSGDYVFVAR